MQRKLKCRMGSAAVQIFTISTLVGAASGAHVTDRPGADAGKYIPHKADKNVTCILNEPCTLPCPLKGELQEAFWIRQDKPMIHIVDHPVPERPVQHFDYREKAWMSLDQPGGGANLVIRAVELKHQGLHRCSVTSSTGDTDRFIDLQLYTLVKNVSLHQDGQQLFCRSEGIYPEPVLVWTPVSSDLKNTQTWINVTEQGLFTISSSITLSPGSSAKDFTCNISTPYWWKAETIKARGEAALDDSNPNYLWTLVLVPIVAVAAAVLFFCRHKLQQEQQLWKKNTPTSHNEEAGVQERLNGSTLQPVENGHLKVQHKETAL